MLETGPFQTAKRIKLEAGAEAEILTLPPPEPEPEDHDLLQVGAEVVVVASGKEMVQAPLPQVAPEGKNLYPTL